MKRGELIRLTIEGLAPDGSGLAVKEGRKIAVRGALPGDEVDVRVLGVKRGTARVRLESVVSAGIERIDPRCPHFEHCGGCRWQNVPYEVQCCLKANLVRDSLANVPGMEIPANVEIVPSPDVFFYRNKMEFSFDAPPREEGRLFLGLHEAGRYDRVFDIDHCMLQSDVSNTLVSAARRFAEERGLTAYGLKSHKGLLRYLMVRDGKYTGDVMVNLVTSGEDFPDVGAFARVMSASVPEITTVIRSINRGKGGVTTGEEREILSGEGCIRESIGGQTFVVSPDSFFQTNPQQTVNLYACIGEFCDLSGCERLLDLYCGTGTIGLSLAAGAAHVTGIELVDDAIRDARVNAGLNGIDNIEFITGKVEDRIDESAGEFDVVVCDPPRAGIHPKALSHLLRLRIPRMVYVSCNIKALPKDLEMLAMAGYRLKDIRAFDMSPHTPHIETVVKLEIDS